MQMGPGRISGRSQFVLPSARSWTGDQRNPCRLCTPVQFPRKSNRGPMGTRSRSPSSVYRPPGKKRQAATVSRLRNGSRQLPRPGIPNRPYQYPGGKSRPGIRPPKNIYNSPVPDIRGIDIADCGRGWPKSTPFPFFTHDT